MGARPEHDLPGQLLKLAALIKQRNELDDAIARLINRPALSGHVGEWIASRVFDIELETSASAKAIDGRFRSGPIAGATVNIKTYGKREGLLDTTADESCEYYLVLTGPKSTSLTSKGGTRPWCISNVYLFDAHALRLDQTNRGIKSGTASSVRFALWEAAEVWPKPTNPVLPLRAEQSESLALFHV